MAEVFATPLTACCPAAALAQLIAALRGKSSTEVGRRTGLSGGVSLAVGLSPGTQNVVVLAVGRGCPGKVVVSVGGIVSAGLAW